MPTEATKPTNPRLTGRIAGKAVAECISDDALIHLKSYQYSAVDKSPVSYYILRPYVRLCAAPIRAGGPRAEVPRRKLPG